jgi:NADPH-dependent dioxygenase
MPNNTQTEVLVVGAGPVGMLTALLLTQHGIRTRIIDQESRTAAHSYACALHPASLGLLERAGIAEDVIELGHRIETVGIYEGAARRTQANFSGLPGRHPFVVVLEQSVLEDLLEQRLRGCGGKVEWNHRLCQIEPGADGVEASIEKLAPSGRGYIIPEFETVVKDRLKGRADFVVGADGHNSLLRQQLDIRSVRAGAAELYAVYEIETVEPADHEMKLVLSDGAVSVLWPLAENKCRWSFQVVPPAAAAEFPQKDRDRLIIVQAPSDWDSLHHLQHFRAERAPWFQAHIKGVIWTAHVQFERQLAAKFGQGRCWLAGDAAHQASPAGMHSMNAGLREAADLADKFKSILRDHADLGVLRNYEEVHRAEWEALLGLKRAAEPPSQLSPWVREHFPVILSSLPASGEDLSHLLEKL